MFSVGLQPVRFRPCGILCDAPKDAHLMNEVFTDENGNARSDIGMYQSSETSPEVRSFVANLMTPLGDTEKLPDKYRDDDAIVQAMPDHGETLNQYEKRVDSMLNDEKQARKTAKAEKKLKEALKQVGIS